MRTGRPPASAITVASVPARALAAAALALCACARLKAAPDALLARAAVAAEGSGASPRQVALAGWHAYLIAGEPDRARALFDRAIAADSADPVARAGAAELARRAARPELEAAQWLELCPAAPRHPLCAVAARRIAAAVGLSPVLDRAVDAGAVRALSAGAAGDAAHLLGIARLDAARHRGDDPRPAAAALGAIATWRVAGPLSPYRALDFDTPLGPERDHAFDDAYQAPLGRLACRTFEFPDGRVVLAGDPAAGDGYVLGADVTVTRAGEYLLTLLSAAEFVAWVDGERVARRRAVDRPEPTEAAVGLALSAGRHRLLVKLFRGDDRGDFAAFLAPADGSAAEIAVQPASGPAPFPRRPAPPAAAAPGGTIVRPTRSAHPTAESLRHALDPELGPTLATALAAYDGLRRDREGAKAVARALGADGAGSAAISMLRAALASDDPTLPGRVGAGRATRELEAATTRDPAEASAWLLRADQAADGGRHDEAADLLARARAASPDSPEVDLAEAHLAVARGLDALADAHARRAAERFPGGCEALSLRYDLARRAEAARAADVLAVELAGCPGGRARLAEHRRLRGDLDAAASLYAALAAHGPADPAPEAALAQIGMARGAYRDAAARYARLEAAWPRISLYPKRRADALDLAGDAAGARAARERALLTDGSDLGLRRQIALAAGQDVLDDAAIDGRAAIAAYESRARNEDAPGVYVLDAAAIEVAPDGAQIERVHTVTKVLDAEAVHRLAEVHLPAGAQPLSVRVLKPDGRVLEPESIGAKEGLSLPDVGVGDYVEVEYLSAVGPRGPALPGWATTRFYYQVAQMPLARSILEVRAPPGTAPEVDAHQMTVDPAASPRVVIERRNVPAHLPEPDSPATEEFLPFVQVGIGAGNDELALAFADALAYRAAVTREIEDFAREAAGSTTGLEAARRVYARLTDAVKGTETSLSEPASFALARGRGNRLLVLKAALAALGIRSHIALVRTFLADPAPYRFPTPERSAYPVLVLSFPGTGLVWLDPNLRHAPFSALAPQVAGQDAVILPSLGRTLRHARTLENPDEPRQVTGTLALGEDGRLTGTGREVYRGVTAAYLKVGLEPLGPESRRQTVESALARAFRGARLESFQIDESGAEVVLAYAFAADGHARTEGDRLVLPGPTVPALLGQRFVKSAARSVPLLVGAPEHVVTHVELLLPPGRLPATSVGPIALDGPFGSFSRTERTADGKLVVEETFRLRMQRVAPRDYAEFARFAAVVDRAQGREIELVRRSAGRAAPGDSRLAAAR